jgi:hypothetical protein
MTAGMGFYKQGGRLESQGEIGISALASPGSHRRVSAKRQKAFQGRRV